MTDTKMHEKNVVLIRKGNAYFNKGEIQLAKECFVKANYDVGIRRIADYYLYDKKALLEALPLYIKCKSKPHIELIYKSIAKSLKTWLHNDTIKPIQSPKKQRQKTLKKETKSTAKNNTVYNNNISDNIKKTYPEKEFAKPKFAKPKSVRETIEESIKRKNK